MIEMFSTHQNWLKNLVDVEMARVKLQIEGKAAEEVTGMHHTFAGERGALSEQVPS